MKLITRDRPAMNFPVLSTFFDDFFRDDKNFFPSWKNGAQLPAVNVSEKDDSFELEVAAPGLKKSDFNIEVKDGVMTVSSEVQSEKEEKEENYTRKEFSYTAFSRSFWLPQGVKEDNIKATYKEGILTVVIPKLEVKAVPPPKKVKIS